MDDQSAGDRVRKLRGEIAQLTARADTVNDTLGTPPAPPPPGTTERLHGYLARTISNGSPSERKTAIEALIAEIRITEEGIIPVFRIPSPGTSVPGDGADTIDATDPVRAMVRSVGRLGLEPRTGGL
jgi:site-specific DNA recombinase